jgi:hypothetical protein
MRQADVDSGYLFGDSLQLSAFRSTDKANLNWRIRPHSLEANFTTVLENFHQPTLILLTGSQSRHFGCEAPSAPTESDRSFPARM